ncbi:7tm 1 domain containing protein [Asbolus verrucosus]|uniref:7tm 1 domain containing protein n=1 Tax=Asbolus verrucosus TaxID=1661398 RepID=A0A482W359_ASBVE|nr:7tm 1 domain containing protein [Asbolus verrucosus]
MLRMLGAAQKREVKSTQNLAIIVLFFMICWIPLYTINCILAFCKNCNINATFMFFCIILSHLNSAGNPILYAYHLRDFRSALKNFFCNLFSYSDPQLQTHNQNRAFSSRKTNKTSYNSERRYSSSQIYYRKKSVDIALLPKVSTTTTGETNRDIWNIPEGSSDSSDSLKHLEHSRHEKLSIVRPPTPYRPRKTSDISQINQGYIETSSIEEENDDVFVDDTFPFSEFKYNDSELETSLTDKIKCEIKIVPALSRNLFFVESDFDNGTKPQFIRSCSYAEKSTSVDFTSLVGGMFNNKQILGRSLSDDGTTSNESIIRKSNGAVIKSSCGS